MQKNSEILKKISHNARNFRFNGLGGGNRERRAAAGRNYQHVLKMGWNIYCSIPRCHPRKPCILNSNESCENVLEDRWWILYLQDLGIIVHDHDIIIIY